MDADDLLNTGWRSRRYSPFLTIAFLGVLPPELLTAVFISNFIFKVGVEVLFTPITYKVVNLLKKAEQEDFFDRGTKFNPFSRS